MALPSEVRTLFPSSKQTVSCLCEMHWNLHGVAYGAGKLLGSSLPPPPFDGSPSMQCLRWGHTGFRTEGVVQLASSFFGPYSWCWLVCNSDSPFYKNAHMTEKKKYRYLTREFPNSGRGQTKKIQAVDRLESEGWEVVEESIQPGQLEAGSAFCLFIICMPLAFFAYKNGKIIVSLRKER
jgi:hypothetical protein